MDTLKLPFTKVALTHNDQPYFCPKLWAKSKIATYATKTKPFLHVDADVYTWKKLFHSDDYGLCAQNLEDNFIYNANTIKIAMSLNLSIPPFIPANAQPLIINAVNAGVFGGSDVDFIGKYCEQAFEFYSINSAKLESANGVDISSLNSFMEQVLFFYLAQKENKTINYLLDENIVSQYYKGLVNFENIPFKTTFIHAL